MADVEVQRQLVPMYLEVLDGAIADYEGTIHGRHLKDARAMLANPNPSFWDEVEKDDSAHLTALRLTCDDCDATCGTRQLFGR